MLINAISSCSVRREPFDCSYQRRRASTCDCLQRRWQPSRQGGRGAQDCCQRPGARLPTWAQRFRDLNHVISHYNDLSPLTVFCEAGQPSVCEPHTVVRPTGLSKRIPVPYLPLSQFGAKPPFTFNPSKHHMDLAKFSSSWWGNCSYGYAHTPGRHHQFVKRLTATGSG